MAGNLALQIFPNFFLVEIWEINGLSPKKLGFVVFSNLAASFVAAALRIGDYQET
jgi:hypothetical protein